MHTAHVPLTPSNMFVEYNVRPRGYIELYSLIQLSNDTQDQCFNINTIFQCIGNFVSKMNWSRERVINVIGIPLLVNWNIAIETTHTPRFVILHWRSVWVCDWLKHMERSIYSWIPIKLSFAILSIFDDKLYKRIHSFYFDISHFVVN